jgi:leucyl-tRNA synthetase
MGSYDPSTVEQKWQKRWASDNLYRTPDSVRGKRNFMLLAEFPYPSGNLHIGHWYTFAVSDTLARYLRMQGYNVLYPIGFDAFGLPAENAAIKYGSTPGEWTKANIATMTEQLRSMGASFDWSRVIDTSRPDYYRWTQWIFLKLLKKKLAYRAVARVNWCPSDKTVLANEQVVNGCCERCDTQVVQRDIEQWMFRTTAYADALVDDFEGLDWPNTTRAAQTNWVGRSEGARMRWILRGIPGQEDGTHHVETYTTRPDTIYGATFVVISPETANQWLDAGWQASRQVKDYVAQSLRKRELERMEGGTTKTGVPTGIHAVNPVSHELVPVWVADYVLGSYGTGAIMAVPAHDQRDFEFAAAFNLPVIEVIRSSDASLAGGESAYEGPGVLVNSGPYDGMTSADAAARIIEELKRTGTGGPQKTYKLRDWVLSRQRYWGCPIPMVNCPECGYVPVPETDLPVLLPMLDDFKPSDDGRSPLAKASDWLKVRCPKCEQWAERETDTMDTFVDSSWYFIRYADPTDAKRIADPKKMADWLPVPLYIGGPEHNTMHLLYARFVTKALHDAKVVPFKEPFTARRNHSVILGADGNRMSKSRGNVVDPDAEVARYGADTVRMYLAFMGPYSDQTMPWDPNGITGVARFVERIWKLFQQAAAEHSDEAVERALHRASIAVGNDISLLRYNTAVSGMMKLLNLIGEHGNTLTDAQRERFTLLLAPLAPHLAEELWREILRKPSSVHLEPWPAADPAMLHDATVSLPVQVNGKLRGHLLLAPDAPEQEAIFAARQDEAIARHLGDGELRKTVYLPGKLLNLVVS